MSPAVLLLLSSLALLDAGGELLALGLRTSWQAHILSAIRVSRQCSAEQLPDR